VTPAAELAHAATLAAVVFLVWTGWTIARALLGK
jgi:hypothetical protein